MKFSTFAFLAFATQAIAARSSARMAKRELIKDSEPVDPDFAPRVRSVKRSEGSVQWSGPSGGFPHKSKDEEEEVEPVKRAEGSVQWSGPSGGFPHKSKDEEEEVEPVKRAEGSVQ
ncbi:hypothetical protein Vi05172_g4483 [Venturia inaequalis]|nr:hypothetical protein EG327_006623 [Venturia inaequalis]RDI85565.1 hypothetical protein Vi05172_g4483 [Venturia inaequalis]